MKKLIAISALFITLFLVAGLIAGKAEASVTGTNITIFDGHEEAAADAFEMNYQGVGVGLEDQETEPDTAQGEVWDLEAFYLDGAMLSMVGQWDFVNGYNGYYSGDIFINLGQDDLYEYVFDVDWENLSYDLYKLGTDYATESVSYMTTSNPYRIDVDNSAGLELLASSTFLDGTLDEATASALGLYGSSVHYVVSGFDMAAILADLGVSSLEFYSHFTLSCGNDDMEGHGVAVPEPSTLLLAGFGMVGLAMASRRKIIA